jgi:hypothetical protein
VPFNEIGKEIKDGTLDGPPGGSFPGFYRFYSPPAQVDDFRPGRNGQCISSWKNSWDYRAGYRQAGNLIEDSLIGTQDG